MNYLSLYIQMSWQIFVEIHGFLHIYKYTCNIYNQKIYIHQDIYIYILFLTRCTDIYMNTPEVVLATIKGACGRPRVSAHTLQQAILRFYTEANLYPSGVYSDIPAVQTWALKYGMAIKKLVLLPKNSEPLFSFQILLVIFRPAKTFTNSNHMFWSNIVCLKIHV